MEYLIKFQVDFNLKVTESTDLKTSNVKKQMLQELEQKILRNLEPVVEYQALNVVQMIKDNRHITIEGWNTSCNGAFK